MENTKIEIWWKSKEYNVDFNLFLNNDINITFKQLFNYGTM